MLTVYGIKNCDTVQRARQRLDEAGIAYRFHDFKVDGLSASTAQAWIDALGGDVVVNRKGTSWRRLDAATQAALGTDQAAALLAQQASLVKRPVFAKDDGGLLIGFPKSDEDAILARLG